MKVNAINSMSFNGRRIIGREDIKIIPSSRPTDLERSIEKKIEVDPSPTVVKKFANGEIYINIQDDMRNKDVYIMPTTGTTVNDNLMETYLKADAAHRMGAHKVIAVLPNFPYGRQERKTEPGEPISARVNIALLHASGVDEVITADMHAPALQGFTRQMKITELTSLEAMIKYLREKTFNNEDLVVVSPDLGGVKRADKLANELKCSKAVIYKHRSGHNQASAEMLLGDVADKDCIIYDDIIDTAGTITEAARMLHENGAKRIFICASHGLFNGPALDRIDKAPVEEVIVTNSEQDPHHSKIKQVDIADEVVGAMLNISC